jgi:hypothetical protein
MKASPIEEGATAMETLSDTSQVTDEAKAAFDYTCRHYLNLSGEDFLRQYDSGFYRPLNQDDTKLRRVLAMLPFAR